MSAKAPEQVPPGDSCRPSSGLLDVNDAENDQLHPQPIGPKKDVDNGSRVLPPDGECNVIPAASSEDSSSGFSLARLLRSLAPQVSLVLENTGSVARDHLANERTWLAYVRTSLSIAGTGVALVQLFTISESINLLGTGVSLRHFARPLGAATVLLALFILSIGVMRYFKIQAAMAQGLFPAARATIVIITAALAALVSITFGVLVALPS